MTDAPFSRSQIQLAAFYVVSGAKLRFPPGSWLFNPWLPLIGPR